MARPPEVPELPFLPGPVTQAVVILDAFLDSCQTNKAARTYAWYRENIQRFAVAPPKGLKVTELKAYHIAKAMDPYPNWANNTKHVFIGTDEAEEEGRGWGCDWGRKMAIESNRRNTITWGFQAINPRRIINGSFVKGSEFREGGSASVRSKDRT